MKNPQWNVYEKCFDQKISRILLMGLPGTGKTTTPCLQSGQNGHYSITLHEETSVAEIIGHWVPKEHAFVWHDGVAIKAWKEGKLLVINEIDKSSGAALTVLRAVLDDPEIAHLYLPSGEMVKPANGFRIVATMNGELSDLPIPLIDRFDVKIYIDYPHPDAIKKLEDPKLQKLVDRAYKNLSPPVTFREVLALEKLLPIFKDQAFSIIWPVNGNEIKELYKIL